MSDCRPRATAPLQEGLFTLLLAFRLHNRTVSLAVPAAFIHQFKTEGFLQQKTNCSNLLFSSKRITWYQIVSEQTSIGWQTTAKELINIDVTCVRLISELNFPDLKCILYTAYDHNLRALHQSAALQSISVTPIESMMSQWINCPEIKRLNSIHE